MIRSVPVLVLCILVVSCSLVPIDRSDLIGTFVADYPGGVDVLVLRDDSTFTQYYLGYHDTLPFMWIDSGVWHVYGPAIEAKGILDGYRVISIKPSNKPLEFVRDDLSSQIKLLIEVEPTEYSYRLVSDAEHSKEIFDSLSREFRLEHKIKNQIPTYNNENSPDLK